MHTIVSGTLDIISLILFATLVVEIIAYYFKRKKTVKGEIVSFFMFYVAFVITFVLLGVVLITQARY